MTATAPAAVHPQTSKKQALILELVDRQASDYILEGTAGTAYEERLDHPGRRKILSTGYMWDPNAGDDGEFVAIRYIKGCPYIRVSEQESRNIQPNPRKDLIWFDGPTLTIVWDSRNPGLYEFLQNHPGNVTNPCRPQEADKIFMEIRQAEIARASIHDLALERRASAIVGELYKETADGIEYNIPLIDMISTLYGFGYLESPEEKVIAISNKSKEDPGAFVHSIANAEQSYKIDVSEAVKLNVISISGDSAAFADGKTFGPRFRSRKMDVKVDELARHLLTDEGKQDYNQLIIQLNAARAAVLEPA